MSAAIYKLLRGSGFRAIPWTNQELAELFRVADILKEAGLPIETDSGLSDEGDPWFVFCRTDSGDVVAHFARIDGEVVACGLPRDAVFRGRDFRAVARQLLSDQPLVLPRRHDDSTTLLHPAVIITAFVATALLYSTEGRAETLQTIGEDGVLREVLEPTSSAIFSFLAYGEARSDGKQAEQNPALGQLSLISILSAMLAASAGQDALAEDPGSGRFDFAGATRSLGEQSTVAPTQVIATRQDGEMEEAIDGVEAAFGLEQLFVDSDGNTTDAGGSGEGFLLALAQSIGGASHATGSRGGDAPARGSLSGEGEEMRGLANVDLASETLAAHMTAAAAGEKQGDGGHGEASSGDTDAPEERTASESESRELGGFNLRDGGLVFESGSGSASNGDGFVLALTKSAFAMRLGELAEQEASGAIEVGESGDSGALDEREAGQLDPSGTQPVVFSGGFLLIENFQVGVDVLLIDDAVLNPGSAVVQKHGLDLVMDFGKHGMITLVGAMDSFVDVV